MPLSNGSTRTYNKAGRVQFTIRCLLGLLAHLPARGPFGQQRARQPQTNDHAPAARSGAGTASIAPPFKTSLLSSIITVTGAPLLDLDFGGIENARRPLRTGHRIRCSSSARPA